MRRQARVTIVAFALSALALSAAPSPARAQDARPSTAPSAPVAQAPAPLRDLEAFDLNLARTTQLGIYLRRQRVGLLTIAIDKAPPESGAVYVEHTTLALELSGTSYRQDVKVYMRGDLSLVKKETSESGTRPEGTTKRTTTIERKGEEWVRTHLQGEGGTRSADRTGYAGPNYGPCLTAVASKLAQTPGTHALPAILWVGRERKETGPATLQVIVKEPQEVSHRGKKLRAVSVRITGKGDPLELWLTPDGRLLTMTGKGIPYRFVQGTADEVARDLPAPAAPPAAELGEKSPRDAVHTFLLCLARALPADRLDSVVDFAAVLARLEAEDPAAAGKVTAAELATLFKTRVERSQGPVSEKLAEEQVGKAKVKITGDTARVRIPQHKEPFLLSKTAVGRWRIVAWPAK